MYGLKTSAHLMRAVISRNPGLNAAEIDDIYWGCVQQTLEQGFNIARNASLLAEILTAYPLLPLIACVAHQCKLCMMAHEPLWWVMRRSV